jgi:zinc/manganese transport system substrate-binding protein
MIRPLFLQYLLITLSILTPHVSYSAVKVVATIPDIAWAVEEIGGDKVEVHSLLKGTENPHFADAVPEFIRLVADADMVCLVGLELEVGWLPKVLSRSGNSHVQPNGKGYCDLGKKVPALEKPIGQVDRSMGDIHPFGNPHYWLSPVVFANAAQVIVDTLKELDSQNSATYSSRYQSFVSKMNQTKKRNQAKLSKFLTRHADSHFLEYHREFIYLADAYGMKSYGSIEEKPGIPPSAGQITKVALAAKSAHIPVALAAEYNPKNVMEKFKEVSGISIVTLPTMIHTQGPIKNYIELQDWIIDSILKAVDSSSPSQK